MKQVLSILNAFDFEIGSIITIIFIFIFIYSIIELVNSKRKIIFIIKSNNRPLHSKCVRFRNFVNSFSRNILSTQYRKLKWKKYRAKQFPLDCDLHCYNLTYHHPTRNQCGFTPPKIISYFEIVAF